MIHAALAVLLLFSRQAEANPFLTLPLTQQDATVFHGWWYGRIIPDRKPNHQAIDYPTELGEPVIAAADGFAMASESWKDRGYGAFGRFVMIRHSEIHEPSGLPYTTLYAHLRDAAPHIVRKPQWDENYPSWTPIKRGEIIGHADTSGTSWTHLHFELFYGPYGQRTNRRVDPYNLYTVPRSYPGDGVGTGQTGYLWTAFPPQPPNPLDEDNDSDGLTENEGDCDDTDPTARPNTFERCNNNRDDNCDGVTDEEIHPLGEGCMFKHEGCLYEGVWLCGEGGETLCTPFQPLTCVCQDECQNVGAGTCIIDNGRSAARICAADNASLCNKFIIMPCSSHTCEEGRCGPVSRGQPCQSSNECQGGNRCIRSNCTNRSVCTNYCSFDRDCARCEVCAPAQNGHACFRGINYGFSADIEDGCPCASKTEPKCEDGNPCSPGSFCALERPGEELPYPCFMAGYGQECTCYRL